MDLRSALDEAEDELRELTEAKERVENVVAMAAARRESSRRAAQSYEVEYRFRTGKCIGGDLIFRSRFILVKP